MINLGTDAVVKKGQTVVVYTPSIHFSEDNFVNAKEFDPENFDQSNLKNKFAHMAFGQGPRNCIGMRYVQILYLNYNHILK